MIREAENGAITPRHFKDCRERSLTSLNVSIQSGRAGFHGWKNYQLIVRRTNFNQAKRIPFNETSTPGRFFNLGLKFVRHEPDRNVILKVRCRSACRGHGERYDP